MSSGSLGEALKKSQKPRPDLTTLLRSLHAINVSVASVSPKLLTGVRKGKRRRLNRVLL